MCLLDPFSQFLKGQLMSVKTVGPSASHIPILNYNRHIAPITAEPCETGPGGTGRAVASETRASRRFMEQAGRSASVICTMPP